MNPKNFNNVKLIIALVILSFLNTGCIKPINLGLIKPERADTLKEFYIDRYKVLLKINTASNVNEYIYSVSFLDKTSLNPITNIKANLEIVKYPPDHWYHTRVRHSKEKIISGLQPDFDTSSASYTYRYQFKGAGKYELSINLNEISGRKLEKEIMILFDQEIL